MCIISFQTAAVFLAFTVSISKCDPVYVKLREGVLHGSTITSDTGIKYEVFKGIPYAKPPIGPLRFKAPQPYGPIKGSFHADKDRPVCPQLDPVSGRFVGDEDCLTLNVFVPEKDQDRPDKKYPVVIFIHGGSFQYGTGSSEVYKPFKFLEREVIVVTFNYRLGALGFLSTLDDIAPGNFGLLDQVETLRWVQQNIGAFGGDVNQITLFGQNAGATSALYHLLSPLSKGLFQRAIAISGAPTCDVSLQKDPVKWATELGIKLDCYVASSNTLLDCLRKRLPEELVSKAAELHDFAHYPLIFLPVVERIHKDNGDFLPDTPVNLLKEARIHRVPVILGANRYEGLQFYQNTVKSNSTSREVFFEETLPAILKATTYYKHNIKAIGAALKKEYYSEINMEDDIQFENVTQDLLADLLVRRCMLQTGKYLSESGWPTYMYVNDDPSWENSLVQDHFYPDDLKYLFLKSDGSDATDTETESKRERILLTMWTNFAKTSMPTPTKSHDVPLTWIPMNPGKIRYLKVDAKPEIIEGYLTRRMKFWDVKVPKVEAGGSKDEL